MSVGARPNNENLAGWNVTYWLFTILGIPVTLPWFVYHIFNTLLFKRRKSSLRGKVVLITGASSGLGEALTHAFYSCGCRLILVARRKDELQRVKNDLLNTHHIVPTYPPVILPLDISELNVLGTEISKVLKIHDRIDILINNAGISYRGEVLDTKVDIDIKVMLVNYFSQIALTKAILPWMIKQGCGHIVCTSSIQGKIAIPYRSAYTASKHALQAWCDSARAELADKNIQITVVNPGYIQTSLSVNALTGVGQKYGVMDETTKTGYTPGYVADQILMAVLRGDKEITIGTFMQNLAILFRNLFPAAFFWIMRKRARRMSKNK